VTLVDAAHALAHLDEVKPDGVENEAVEQVAFADRIVINKTDLVTAAQLEAVIARVRAINGVAEVLTAENARAPLDRLLGVRAFDLARVLAVEPAFLSDADHTHDTSVSSVGIVVEGELDADKTQVRAWGHGESQEAATAAMSPPPPPPPPPLPPIEAQLERLPRSPLSATAPLSPLGHSHIHPAADMAV
jgi:G3E family GTPase